ncbi:hypothetical protein [Methylobacterium sp. P1-11]|uniref:hypothetical protein n=1 Tax=Methylobacterium sp. P1-11 TaxID=2024616 RepID=UPI0011EE4AB0|nr:hypothetical protein [Methylobacterium sp. P1-11]
MADVQQPSWPPYLHNMHGHLHAIGTIVTTWNLLENAYQALLQLIFQRDQVEGQHACELLTLEQQAKLIRGQLFPKLSPDEKDHVDYFLKCAGICKDNRNAISHAHYNIQSEQGDLRFTKGFNRDRTALNQYMFNVPGLREMADSSYLVFMYGLDVWSSIQLRWTKEALPHDPFWAQQPLSLPQKPVQPRSWDQIRVVPTPPPTPPQS